MLAVVDRLVRHVEKGKNAARTVLNAGNNVLDVQFIPHNGDERAVALLPHIIGAMIHANRKKRIGQGIDRHGDDIGTLGTQKTSDLVGDVSHFHRRLLDALLHCCADV